MLDWLRCARSAPARAERQAEQAERRALTIKTDQALVSININIESLLSSSLGAAPTFLALSSAMDQPIPATCVAAPVQKEEPKTSERVPDSPLTVMANQLNEDDVLTNASTARKLTLMALFSAAQFLDAFNNWSVYTIAKLAIIALTLWTLYTVRCFLRFPKSLKSSRLLLRRRRG